MQMIIHMQQAQRSYDLWGTEKFVLIGLFSLFSQSQCRGHALSV